jgi:signal transduction histidine kinase
MLIRPLLDFFKAIENRLTRSHDNVFISFIVFFTLNLLLYLCFSLSEQETLAHLMTLGIVGLIYWAYSVTRAYRACSHVMLALNYLHIFYIALLTGGVHSSAMSWYTFMPTAALMMGRRSALFWLGMSLFFMTLLAGINYLHPEIQNFHMKASDAGWSMMMQVTISVGLLLSIWLYEVLNTQRSKQLEQKSHELAQTHWQLQRAQAHKDEFIASVSHELRTPMNAILGFNELLSLEVKSNQALKIIEHIQASAIQLLRVISDILDYSQLMAHKLSLMRHASDPRELIHNAIEKAQKNAQGKPIAFNLNIADSTPDLCIMDSARIAQVIDHLLGNAMKFMSMGRIEIRMSRASDYLRVEIKDNGIGISPEQQESIFKRFAHANTEINRRYGGTGLGLAICDQLIQLHQGRIGVQSALGQGSTFWFEIPIHLQQPTPQPEPQAVIDNEPVELTPNFFEHYFPKPIRTLLRPIEFSYFWLLNRANEKVSPDIQGHKFEAILNLLFTTSLFSPVYVWMSNNSWLTVIFIGYPFLYLFGLLAIIGGIHARLMIQLLIGLSCAYLLALSLFLGGSHGTMNWLVLIPLSALNLLGLISGVAWLGVTIALQFVMVYFTQHDLLPIPAEQAEQPIALFWFAYVHMAVLILNLPLHYKNLTARIRRKLQFNHEILERTQIKLLNEQKQKNEFIASVSHEFRTPMNAIIGFNHLLKDEIKNEKNALELQSHVTKSAEHLLTVIDDILDYSQLQSGNLSIRDEVFDVHQIVQNAFGMFQTRVKELNLDYRLKLGELPQWIKGDNHRLMQILVNLIGNALKFTEQGFVEVRAGGFNNGILFEVQDSGIGIAHDKLPLIFGQYEQAHTQEVKRYAGHGLGLAISKRLTEIQKGHIDVQSQLGLGSCFRVCCPIQLAKRPTIYRYKKALTLRSATA